MKHTKITQTERELLGQWKKEKIANKEIARRLGRPVLTIRRELKRNKTRVAVGSAIMAPICSSPARMSVYP